ncbi:MAG: PDGLE domain-containing protein [Acidimicrobiia bacterium]|nr:PDGLE domain-containing protein [Acidimicrobiia bacterium]
MDRRTWGFVAGGLVVALLVAGGLSLLASGEPDGLERVSIDQGFDDAAQAPSLDSPLADYAVEGVENSGLSTALAGIVGVVVTLLLTVGILKIVQHRRPPDPGPSV